MCGVTEQQFKKIVWCNRNQALTRSFVDVEDAVSYANSLLKKGERVVLRDYKPRRRQIDRIAEQWPDGPPWLRKN